MGYRPGRSADPVRHSRSRQRNQSPRDRRAAPRQPHPDPQPRRRGQGPEEFQARGPATRRHPLLRLSDHGRHRPADAGAGGRELVAALQARPFRQPSVPAGLRVDGAAGFRRGPRRLDDDGSRPPALDRLWDASDRRFGAAVAHRRRCPGLVAGIHGGVSADLSDRLLCDGAHHSRRPRRGASRRLADRERTPERSRPGRTPYGRKVAMNAVLDLVPVWTLILGAGIFFYVLLDGFDLGVGMLYGFMTDTGSRNTVMSAIAPVWDGNETWLVLGGVGLLAAFPLAFAIIVPALYFPIAIMLLALVFRGVAFEFRFRDAERRTFWDYGFFCGSAIATVAQGVMLGAFIQGFRVYGRFCLAGVLVALLLVSVWTPLTSEQIARRWFSWPNILLLSPVPVATALVAFGTWRALSGTSQSGGFIGAIGLFALSYAGIAISLWPMIVPHHYTLWQAASSPSTQAFLAVGTLFLLPVILFYTGWSYWVFRGKVRADVGYH